MAAINLPLDPPISHHTRSRTPADDTHMITLRKTSSRVYPKALLTILPMPVMDEETGKILNYRQLRTHPKLAQIWNQS